LDNIRQGISTGLHEASFDVIFFDLPGMLNCEGVLKMLASMDYIFTTVSADRFVLESTLQYATLTSAWIKVY
jgi:cellulose biosynthesis protein BcsQ